MDRERMQALSLKTLQNLALKEGIEEEFFHDRQKLIEQIIEAKEEDREERAISNNCAMRLKGKKYDIMRDEEVETVITENYNLPDRYNETRIVLLLRDPLWAYAYWDIKDTELAELHADPFYNGLFLRVYELKDPTPAKKTVLDFFDIPIKESDDCWYINLNKAGRYYCVELFSEVHSKVTPLCVSNVVHSPLGYIAEHRDDFFNDPDSMMIILSGLWDYEPGEDEQTAIPQRIISILDSQEISME